MGITREARHCQYKLAVSKSCMGLAVFMQPNTGVLFPFQVHDSKDIVAAQQRKEGALLQHGMVELQLQFPAADAATLSNIYAAAGESLDDARQVSSSCAKVRMCICELKSLRLHSSAL